MEKKTLIPTVICIIVLAISIIGNLLLWRRLEGTNSQMMAIETQIQRRLDEITSQIDTSFQGMTLRITTTENRLNETASQLCEWEQKIENLTAAKTWHKVEAFSGSGDEITGIFYVKGDLWRIVWVAEAEIPSFAGFAMFIYPQGETKLFVSSVGIYPHEFALINPQGAVEYIVGNGDYYIEIITANLDEWTVMVESYH